MFLSLEKVKTSLLHNEIDVTEFHELFSKIITDCSKGTKGNFKVILEQRPIYQMLEMMEKVDDQWKIDQQIAFNSDSKSVIEEKANALKYFEKEILKKGINRY